MNRRGIPPHQHNTTPGPGNSSNILLLLDTCGLRIALIHNGYHRTYLQRRRRRKKKVKQKEKKEKWNRDSLEALWNVSTRPPSPLLLYLQSVERTKALKGFFTAKQYCFIMSVITIALAFGCYKNPYLSLFNLNCGFHLLMSSLAAIDLAKRRAALRGSKPRHSVSPLLALKWSKESLTSNKRER